MPCCQGGGSADDGEEHAPEVQGAHSGAADDRIERAGNNGAADGGSYPQSGIIAMKIKHLADREPDQQANDKPADNSDKPVDS